MRVEPPDRASPDGGGPDRRQAAFALAAALALVLAAFVAPAANASLGEFPADDDGAQEQEQEQGDGGSSRYRVPVLTFFDEILDWLLAVMEPANGAGEATGHTCTITLAGERFPGATVTARVTYDGEPLADAPVWFNDRHVGRTDAEGTVSGTVPYQKALVITVSVEDRPDCQTSKVGLDRSADAGVAAGSMASPTRTTSSSSLAAFSPVGVAAAQEGSSEPTATYPVDATARLAVVGEPLPGATVTVRARLDDRPFPNATLSVNGRTVGRTDATGRARFAVPDDGTDQLSVRVKRGDFEANTTVDVLLLEARLEPTGLAVVPGAPAVVNATYGNVPLRGASVTVAGEHRGVTGSDGHRRVDLPLDPTAPVVVRANDQTATTSIAAIYDLPVAIFLGLLAVFCVVAYRQWGTEGVAGVVWVAASLVAVVVADAFYGRPGRNVVLAVVTATTLLYAVYRLRSSLAAGTETTAGLCRRLVSRLRTVVGRLPRIASDLRDLPHWLAALAGVLRERLLAATVAVAGALETLVETLGSLPRSGRELAVLAVTRLRALAGWVLEELRRVPPVRVALLLAALAVVAGAYLLVGRVGSVVALAVVALGWLWHRISSTRTDDEATDGTDGAHPGEPVPDLGASTLRQLWRAFARAVAGDRWRTRTPHEVARAAVDEGYPREPVAVLTTLFREVEYGRRSLSAAVRDRAATAYAAIRDRDRGDEP